MHNEQKQPIVNCKECGQPMHWIWSQGTWSDGAWVIRCHNAGRFANDDGCFMCGEAFSPGTYERDFKQRRVMRVIRNAQAGIIYRNPDGTVQEWIAEAIELGIVPPDWEKPHAHG